MWQWSGKGLGPASLVLCVCPLNNSNRVERMPAQSIGSFIYEGQREGCMHGVELPMEHYGLSSTSLFVSLLID